MNAEAVDRVCAHSLRKAEACQAEGKVGRAFSHYLIVLKLKPHLKDQLKTQLYDVMHKWAEKLCLDDRSKDAWDCYNRALEIFPENDLIHDDLGCFLNRYGPLGAIQSVPYFKKALEINKWNVKALHHLEDVCNTHVERWHYRMLNDSIRNESFKEAIYKKVKAGNTNVLDVGTGTGLLSLFAAEAGAENTYACDSNPVMISMAEKIVPKGKNRIKLIDKHSSEITIPEDMKEPASLLVCEILDCGILGEHILETVLDCWDRLLQPNASVIPASVAFHVCAVECDFISSRSKLKQSRVDEFGLKNYTIVVEESDYDTASLPMIPGGYKKLSDVKTPLTINFEKPDEIRSILKGDKDLCLAFEIKENGSLDCLAGWFTLSLDNEISLNSGPGGNVTCWDQAIFLNPHGMTVTQGQVIEILLSFSNGRIQATFPCGTPNQEIIISETVVAMLNNDEYVSVMQETAKSLSQLSGHSSVLDLSPFPVIGLSVLAGKNGTLWSTCSLNDRSLVSAAADFFDVKVKFFHIEELDEVFQHEEPFDLIVIDPVAANGELQSNQLVILADLRNKLKPNGVLLPESIEICGQLIASPWLTRVSRVLNRDVTCGYDVTLINEYSVEHQLDFRIESIGAQELSQPFKLLDISLKNEVNFLESEVEVADTLRADTADALIYWYNIRYGSKSLSTRASGHINISAVLLDVNLGESVKIKTNYCDGLFISRII